MTTNDVIIDRGRGPEIQGTRVTVYSVLDYLLAAWHPHRIAALFQVSSQQVDAAIEYILEHKLEVMRNYVQILERCARGNPPELQAQLNAGHERFQQFKARVQALEETDPEVRQVKIEGLIRDYRQAMMQGGSDAGDNGRQ